MDSENLTWRSLSLKHAGKCFECGMILNVGEKALWNSSTRSIKCLKHTMATPVPPPQLIKTKFSSSSESPTALVDPGEAGGFAKAEANRRIEQRKERVNTRFPRVGKFLLAVTDEPQSTRAWEAGAKGEVGVGQKLDQLASKYGLKVLHDRRIPNSRANIDHIAVTRAGVFVIDAKNYSGTIRIVDKNGFFAPADYKLFVGGRDCTKLVTGMHRQTEVVQKMVANSSITMPVVGVLAFYHGKWEPLSSLFPQEVVQGVLINNKGIEQIVTRPGEYTLEEIAEVTHLLANCLASNS